MKAAKLGWRDGQDRAVAGDDLEVVRALRLRPSLASAVYALDAAVSMSGLDWRLHELVRIRVAQINQCTVS